MALYVIEKTRYWDSDNTDYSVKLLTLSPIKNYGDALERIKRDIETHEYTWSPSNYANPFFVDDKGIKYIYEIKQIPRGDYTWLDYAKITPIQVYDCYQVKHNLTSCGVV